MGYPERMSFSKPPLPPYPLSIFTTKTQCKDFVRVAVIFDTRKGRGVRGKKQWTWTVLTYSNNRTLTSPAHLSDLWSLILSSLTWPQFGANTGPCCAFQVLNRQSQS